MDEPEVLLEELSAAEVVAVKPPAPRVRYTHAAMIDLIIASPGISQNALAAHFGYTPPWVSTIMSSDAFQAALAARREEIVDPSLVATVEERFREVTILSLQKLKAKLEQPTVSDAVVLKAAELGAKAMNIGGVNNSPRAPVEDALSVLATRLVELNRSAKGTTYENEPSAQLQSP